jgi:hypothetical protein
MNYKNNILIIVATHGNEQFSIPVIKKLKKRYPNKFDWVIGNERAIKEDRRFVDADLNRLAPGKRKSALYEQRRARELMDIARRYRYVVDVHGTPARTGLFTIVCNPIPENLLLAAAVPVEQVVIWSDSQCRENGPITQFVPCGVEIECGQKNSLDAQRKLYSVLREFVLKGVSYNSVQINIRQWFQVYGKLINKGGGNKSKLKEFTKTKINKEVFYPLLVGRYQGTPCYKMKKIDWWSLFAF